MSRQTSGMHRIRQALRAYDEHPMPAGDAVLLLDDRVCVEVEQLADRWDEETVSGLAGSLEAATEVRLLVARPRAVLRPSDGRLAAALAGALRPGTRLHPVVAVRARGPEG